ncbi:MAG: alpha amylase N-terminal ig-like domain-containing protein [Candidatus Eiseniibacteriota bacterium]|nr:MAG: alpha amylase N-terminal ig-like domain-containing protein [Candidatus Eisenbacteria bacterium]
MRAVRKTRSREILILGALALSLAIFAPCSEAARKFRVTFAFSPPIPAKTVTLAGTFNNWDPGAQPMEFDPAAGAWTVSIELLEGEYRYKFVVDGREWFHDPKVELKVPDGFGGYNSVLRVGDYERFKQPARRGDGKILAEALYHVPEIPYAQWRDSVTVSLRLRVKKNDVEGCAVVVVPGETESTTGSEEVKFTEIPMKWFAQDGVFEYFRAQVSAPASPVRYVFKARDGSELLYYLSDDSHTATLENVNPFVFSLSEATYFPTPDWVKGRVFYQIFAERFRNGDLTNDPPGVELWDAAPAYFNFFGGDLQGVLDGLGYLDSLGIGGIYFNPIFEATSNHKYNTADYMKIDPHFGTLETFKSLLEEAHRRGIRIVLDGVFNHSGYEFWAFQDIVKNGRASRYVDWYTIHGFPVVKEPKPNYDCWWGFADLPKLRTDNPGVREYIFGVTDFWTREVSIDGWRLDVPNEVPHGFWKEFRKKVKAIGEEKYLLGEIWDNGAAWLGGDEFDAVMNYRFRGALIDFFASEAMDPERFDETLGHTRVDYCDSVNEVMFNLLGSHDTERFLTLCGGDTAKLKLAVLFQMTYPGAPCIYYGDEIGLKGGKDPDCRRTFKWDAERQDAELLEYYRGLVTLRNNHPGLRYGDFFTLLCDRNRNVYAFARECEGELAVVAINNDRSKQPAEIDVSQMLFMHGNGVPDGKTFRDHFSGKTFTLENGKLTIPVMQAKSGLVLLAEE